MTINGIVLLNKNRGVSSNGVVNKVKHLIGADKAGHLGTLDVLGEGLLPITLGKGTKLFDFYLNKDKVYRTIYKFGETTDTLDLEGEVTQKNNVVVTSEMIESVIPNFIGKQQQMPPKYSAKKIKGKNAYALARAGVEFELKPKEIEIYSIKLIKQIEFNTFEFEVHCSSGTYIRSLCRDIAQSLSTYGVMSFIQRTKCGDFDINNSYKLEDIKNGNYEIIKLDSLFNYPEVEFSDDDGTKLLNGCFVAIEMNNCKVKGYYKNEFIGICDINNGKAKIELRLI